MESQGSSQVPDLLPAVADNRAEVEKVERAGKARGSRAESGLGIKNKDHRQYKAGGQDNKKKEKQSVPMKNHSVNNIESIYNIFLGSQFRNTMNSGF